MISDVEDCDRRDDNDDDLKTKKRDFPYEIIPILMMTLTQFKTLTMDEHVEQYQIQKMFTPL